MVSSGGRADSEQTAQATHKTDMNWVPLSEVMVAGTQNLEIHPTAVMEGSGIASGHQDVLSITVNR